MIPLIAPIVGALGHDPIRFGVLFSLNMQVSFPAPPFWPAAFHLKSVAPPEISLGEIFRSLLPFIGIQILTQALVTAFPAIALCYR
ncbi:TRAP transporter large permease subunit [Aureimonas ureilytica]|uniref:TRAP transporter large permease subunit n=1 Tax=Aureimonas ureilytica TaxID=401562 RepID=UPI000365A772|nr:TRAP transporter large permease subunit [Aureimonas ureilytica]